MHVADPHTCSGYATANPEIGNKDNGDVEQLDRDAYDLAPNVRLLFLSHDAPGLCPTRLLDEKH